MKIEIVAMYDEVVIEDVDIVVGTPKSEYIGTVEKKSISYEKHHRIHAINVLQHGLGIKVFTIDESKYISKSPSAVKDYVISYSRRSCECVAGRSDDISRVPTVEVRGDTIYYRNMPTLKNKFSYKSRALFYPYIRRLNILQSVRLPINDVCDIGVIEQLGIISGSDYCSEIEAALTELHDRCSNMFGSLLDVYVSDPAYLKVLTNVFGIVHISILYLPKITEYDVLDFYGVMVDDFIYTDEPSDRSNLGEYSLLWPSDKETIKLGDIDISEHTLSREINYSYYITIVHAESVMCHTTRHIDLGFKLVLTAKK